MIVARGSPARGCVMIQILGPREPRRKRSPEDPPLVNVCSNAGGWERGLSPFVIGPCDLYGGHASLTMENAYQFSKLYARHADDAGVPTRVYWAWARGGWNNPRGVRYPFGRGAVPLGAWWDGELLGYVAARERVYFPLYRDAVRLTEAYRRLSALYRERGQIALWDFDGYDHERLGMSLRDVLHCTDDGRKMGHAFVLKAMLLHGEDVRPEELP
jgi:hypothetical protein